MNLYLLILFYILVAFIFGYAVYASALSSKRRLAITLLTSPFWPILLPSLVVVYAVDHLVREDYNAKR